MFLSDSLLYLQPNYHPLGVFRSSLACFYRVMMEELVSNVKQTHSVPLRTSDPPEVMYINPMTHSHVELERA